MKIKTKILMISSASILIIFGVIMIAFLVIPEIKISTPEGFAVIKTKGDAKEFVCVSPEGIHFRVKIIDNKPKQNLDFWKQALRNKLDQSGYTFLYEEDIASGENNGIYFEWGAPLENSDYVFVTALIVIGDHIAVCESAGERSLMEGYRSVSIKSLETVQYR